MSVLEVYLEPCQISMMELFCENENTWHLTESIIHLCLLCYTLKSAHVIKCFVSLSFLAANVYILNSKLESLKSQNIKLFKLLTVNVKM